MSEVDLAQSASTRRIGASLTHLPAIVGNAITTVASNLRTFLATRRRRFTFLDGRMEVFFLGGFLSDFATVLFGESFWMILYDGWLIDPGGPRMWRSVARHLDRLPAGSVRGVLTTHGHEEHAGNVAAASERLGVPIWTHPACEPAIRSPDRVPLMRRLVIGQPKPCDAPMTSFGDRLVSAATTFEVLPAPGHCDDHIVLYDPEEKLLLSGDAFVSTMFTTPNLDVDSNRWIETLERLEQLDIEVLVTGHGRIFTLREDFPDLPGVVVRRHPRSCLAQKRRFMEWLSVEITRGVARGLTAGEIERRIFAWERPWTRDKAFADATIRCLSLGEFSRERLVQGYLGRPTDHLPGTSSTSRTTATSPPTMSYEN